jgi:hypothetical protein
MRTCDRILSVSAFALALGLSPVFALEGTRPPDVAAASAAAAAPVVPPPSVTRAAQVDVPRPPAPIPRAAGVAPVATIPNANLPRPNGPIPTLAAPSPDRPLPPPNAPAFAAPAAPITPFDAFRSGNRALKDGQKEKALVSLEYAAEQGVIAAQWQLARMYAEGNGVEQSDLRAFEYFSRIADSHADDNPASPQASYVSRSFLALGHYYREGIPDTDVKADTRRARQMYGYAASYFGDADAQYHLARLLLDGTGSSKDPRQAARWLHSAANKGQYQAQAILGRMLFKGETGVPRQAARGLMWIALARSNAAPTETWISDLYDSAFKQANDDERALAGELLVRWVNGRRD